MKTRHLGVLMAILTLGACLNRTEASDAVYPEKTWAHKEAGEAGLNLAKLQALSAYAGGSGCVVRGGFMVYTWGDVARRKDVASAVKPVYTHLLLKAIETGKIADLDALVAKHEPRLQGLNAELGYKDRQISWRHLCNQISGYGVTEAPGQAFDYSDYNMALLFDTLFLKVYGSSWDRVDQDVLHPLLTDLLQCQDKPTFMAFGTGNRPGRLGISPRDFARFGLLYLRTGKWKDRQVLVQELAVSAPRSPVSPKLPRTQGRAAQMIEEQRSIGGGNNQCEHNGSYSNAWWINGANSQGKRNWPDVPTDVYGCFGHGDIRAVVVLPSLDLVVSWNDTRIKGSVMVNQALEHLVEAADAQ
jgi:CubicO group peptidase (beta-lactamase class C family)